MVLSSSPAWPLSVEIQKHFKSSMTLRSRTILRFVLLYESVTMSERFKAIDCSMFEEIPTLQNLMNKGNAEGVTKQKASESPQLA